MKNKVSEFFTYSTSSQQTDWSEVVADQHCRYLGRKCVKIRKSDPGVSIGTCTMAYGRSESDIIICPHRLLEKRRLFMDCLHLLTLHEPGNDLHIVSEVGIPGGSVDYFLVSVRNNSVRDFVGIELQTMDTTGTVWPERQRLLQELGIGIDEVATQSAKPFGMNWKMTAKTILVQLHHKIDTFEHIGKHLVLVLQDHLLTYLRSEFSFDHFSSSALLGDSMQFHSYGLMTDATQNYSLKLSERVSTDSVGIARCLGLQAQAKIELEIIVRLLESKISDRTLFSL